MVQAIDEALTVYVAVGGHPQADGSIARPYATLEAARDHLAGRTSASRPGVVYIRGGHYFCQHGFRINGAAQGHVTYRAYGTEQPIFSGTARLQAASFRRLSEVAGHQYGAAIRVQEAVRDHLFVYDLASAGIPAGSMRKNGFNWQVQPFPPELIVDQHVQTLARYPNHGVMRSDCLLAGQEKQDRVPPEGTARTNWMQARQMGAYSGETPRAYFPDKTDQTKSYEEMLEMKGPILHVVDEALRQRMTRWAPPKDAVDAAAVADADNDYETDGWLSGYFENNYANDRVRIAAIDRDKHLLHTHYPAMQGVQDKRLELTAINLLCELDEPGEYYVDRTRGRHILYYYPHGGTLQDKTIEWTALDEPLFHLEQTTGVHLHGIGLSGTTGAGVVMLDCDDCRVEGCEISHVSLDAIQIGDKAGIAPSPTYGNERGGQRNKVTDCYLHDLGGGGVFVAGGDRPSLMRGDHEVAHNEICRFSRLATYTPAITLKGVGHLAIRNLIYDAPHMAIQVMGNDMRILHNRIERVVMDSADMSAIYAGRDWTMLGNEIAYNYIGGIGSSHSFAIYADDGMSAFDIHHNIFADNKGEAVFFNCGRAHRFTDNLILHHAGGVGHAEVFEVDAQLDIPNARTLIPMFRQMLITAPASQTVNPTTTTKTLWHQHYRARYPRLANWFLPATHAELDHPDCLYATAEYEFARNVQVASADFVAPHVMLQMNPRFDTEKAVIEQEDAICLDRKSGKLDADSVLGRSVGFGPKWLAFWNQQMDLTQVGPRIKTPRRSQEEGVL